ncbi:MAG: hypothetical protein HGA85_00885 [Nanoarchaeota archaeon]|nr:hypothetical protein [Nanoarchaeota archaeon]
MDPDFTVDTRWDLDTNAEHLELLAPLVVADTLRFWTEHDVNLTGPYRRFNTTLSIRGHIGNNHGLDKSVAYLLDNYDQLHSIYGVTLPKDIMTAKAFMDNYKGPFTNITAPHILKILHDHRVFNESPENVMRYCEGHLKWYEQKITKAAQGETVTLRQGNQPAFGIEILGRDPIKNRLAYLVGTAYALGVLDSDLYRSRVRGNKGFGINCAIDLEAMSDAAGTELSFDLKTLSNFDTAEYLGLPLDTDPVKLRDLFYEKVFPQFIRAGITFDKPVRQTSKIADAYIRISRGCSPEPAERKNYGEADSMSFIAGFLWMGDDFFKGMLGGDAWDTMEGLGEWIYPGGHDTHTFNELMGKQSFGPCVAPYLKDELVKYMLDFACEVPPHELANRDFVPPSVSQRYFAEVYHQNAMDFTTLELLDWTTHHIPDLFKVGGVPDKIPSYRMAFERVESKMYWQNLFQKINRYKKEGLFPEGSHIYTLVQ